MTRFVDEVEQPLLVLDKDDIAYCLAGLPCSPGGKHAYLRVLRAFYSWAEDHGLVRFNPCSKVRIKVPKPVRTTIKVIDFPRLLDNCLTMRDKLAVAMLADVCRSILLFRICGKLDDNEFIPWIHCEVGWVV